MALLITACDGSQEAADKPASKPAAEPIQVQKAENAETKTENQKEETWVNPYPEYCFQRVGQISQSGNRDEPRRGDVCEASITGANSYEAGTGSAPRNTASFSISAPSLKSGDLKNVSFLLNRKSKAPSFPTGVHVMDQARVQTIEKPPLPDRIVMGSPLIEDSALIFLFTGPDARHFREHAGGLNLKGYGGQCRASRRNDNRVSICDRNLYTGSCPDGKFRSAIWPNNFRIRNRR